VSMRWLSLLSAMECGEMVVGSLAETCGRFAVLLGGFRFEVSREGGRCWNSHLLPKRQKP
jgi:hypothetical protein